MVVGVGQLLVGALEGEGGEDSIRMVLGPARIEFFSDVVLSEISDLRFRLKI